MQGVPGHPKEPFGEQNQSYQNGGAYNGNADDRVRSTSLGLFSGRSSDSDSPPPKTTEVKRAGYAAVSAQMRQRRAEYG